MRRFDEEATLDRLADRQALPLQVIAKLAWVILRSHQRAPLRDGEAATSALERYLDQNDEAFAARPDLFDPGRARRLAVDARASLAACRNLLVERGKAGYVRRCHGDLHLRNIALIDGEPVLFDAVEFDDGIATGDELYDLAFLLMDLEERGLRRAGNLVLNRYLWESDEAQLSGLAALPVFLSIRSAIRAKVIAAGLDHLHGEERDRAGAEASRYLWFAEAFLTPVPVRLLAIGGLSGTGKSTLAADLAPCLGRAPGAVLLRSDIERKKLFNVAETEKLPDSAYREAANEEVYKRLCRKAALALRAGQAVVLDAVHSRAEERIAVEDVARQLGAAFSGLWLEAPLSVRLDRVGHGNATPPTPTSRSPRRRRPAQRRNDMASGSTRRAIRPRPSRPPARFSDCRLRRIVRRSASDSRRQRPVNEPSISEPPTFPAFRASPRPKSTRENANGRRRPSR